MSRVAFSFNEAWRFSKLPKSENYVEHYAEGFDFCDDDWQGITLPHTWNAIDGADGLSGEDEGGEHYYRGLGCYRKVFSFDSKAYADKRIFIEFKGANTVTELLINEAYVGKHEGGFSAFRFDITDYIKLDSDNIFVVKVNNAPTDYIVPITNQGDFSKMGGIYRSVNIIAVDKVHIDLMDYGSSGVYITPKNIRENSCDIDILVKLANASSSAEQAMVSVDIFDADGNLVKHIDSSADISGLSCSQLKLAMQLDNPILWDGVNNPYLYTAKISISCGDMIDEVSQMFGIRSYYIDAEKGFFLNGKHIDLHGTNYHQDSFESGWAMTNEQRERDYNLMRKLGCNTVRLAHYQHDSYEYELCDKLGITVWTEIGLVNKMSPGNTAEELAIDKRFVDITKQQLIELIRQNYNHPSIIVWGIANELFQMNDEIYDIFCQLNSLANEEDPTRLKTFADSQFWGRFLELPADVVGYNRYFGWYKEAGGVEKFGEWLDEYHKNREKRPICVSEYGGGGAISQHKDNIVWPDEIDPWGKRHYENYQSELHEKIWAQFAKRDYLWGKYVWCMFDFASDYRQEGDTKGVNDKGLVTRDRIPKDAFYFYKSVWNDEPMVHITEKRFSPRQSPAPRIKVYSNCESVELFVNGVSLGEGLNSDDNPTVFVWENVLLDKKSNSILARAKNGDVVIEDEAVIEV